MSIKVKDVNYTYAENTAYEIHALKDINLEIPDGQFIGLIGHTGSGKSTLVQHLNGLIRATGGRIYFNGRDIYGENFSMKELRSKVGLVFQYPEHQLFEIDVLSDVCFGPKNLGCSREEAERKAREALRMVGMGEEYDKSSPFELILDEPTAGLDPRGRDEILDQIERLQKERGITVILVSHSMEDVARYVDRIIVMDHGQVRFDDAPAAVFRHYKELEEIGLAAPQMTYLMHALREKGADVDTDAATVKEAADAIERWLRNRLG